MIKSDYNNRLFSKGIRKEFHLARFKWLSKMLKKYNINTNKVMELGCFDGRSLNYIKPHPNHYFGYDANWENGLEIAKEKYKECSNYFFIECDAPSKLNPANNICNLAISLETLEHIPEDMLDEYLRKILIGLNGYFIVTVPNEKGVIFLIKYILKRFLYGNCDAYSFREFCCAVLGLMRHVKRDQHKGFDYMQLKKQLESNFEIISVSGIPFYNFPIWVNTQVGFVMKTKFISNDHLQ